VGITGAAAQMNLLVSETPLELPQRHIAGGQTAHQCADALLHLDAGKAHGESRLNVCQIVVDKDAFLCFQIVLVQQGLINTRVGLVDMHLTGGNAAVKLLKYAFLSQQLQNVLRDVAQIIDAVTVIFQPPHQLLHPVAGTKDVSPVVQYALYLKLAPGLSGIFQHGVVALKAGDQPGVQLLPFFAAEGQVIDLFLGRGTAQPIDQICLGVKIDHDTAKIKDKEQRRFYESMKRLYSLPDRRTDDEKEADLVEGLGMFF